MTVFLLIYLFTVLWYTLLNRSMGYHEPQTELFWSYRRWFAGNRDLGQEIILNILMFIPFGYLLTAVLPRRPAGTAAVAVSAALFSLLIEALQFHLMRGLFEWDDLFNNLLGALIGFALFRLPEKLLARRLFPAAAFSVGAVFMLLCFGVIFQNGGRAGTGADSSTRAFCFQVDEASVDGGELTLSGFAFRYAGQPSSLTLALRPTEGGKEVKLETACGLPRPDVSDYFRGDRDYADTGFLAKGTVDTDREYEIMIRWLWSAPLATGVFVTGDDVHYAPSASFEEPVTEGAPDLAEIVRNGTLRVYRPDRCCWVYQIGGSLYWIADRDFAFEADGTTYIQYHLWTTQFANLPAKRLAHNNFWDNIGGHFEKYELSGNFGPYRVMKRDLPTAYSITSILTGYYKSGRWIWRSYFRPLYIFN